MVVLVVSLNVTEVADEVAGRFEPDALKPSQMYRVPPAGLSDGYGVVPQDAVMVESFL